MLETRGIVLDDALFEGWRTRIARARAQLRWPATLPMVARRHAAGASLAIAAPMDQLFTACEVNEWALCATLHQRDPERWVGLEAALLAAALEEASEPEAVIAPVLEERGALERFERLAAAERRPDLLALVASAESRNLPCVVDERLVTLGAGVGGRTWPLDALPSPDEVPWRDLRGIPIAAITGSNGKTTTVRLVAACARAHGWTDGFCCTDGVFVSNTLVEPGDYSGPAGTRRVLRDTRVEAAVLETARGGILRRGLAIDRADVAIVTNISNDHFGEYGIDDLAGLADTKATLAQLVARQGLFVLNADDPWLRAVRATLRERLDRCPAFGWFSLDYDHEELLAHRAQGGATCGVRAGRMLLSSERDEHDLGAVGDMPLTVGGTATYNVANLAGAALGSASVGIPPATIRAVFANFARDPADNAGRLMRFDVEGVRFVVDYAHNPDGLRGVLQVARQLRGPGGRLIMLLGHAGNRRDADIAELATVAAAHEPDLVVIKEDEGHLRGRQPGEVPEILRRALRAAGLAEQAVIVRMSERDAAAHAIACARPGDAVALLMHSSGAREDVLARLKSNTGADALRGEDDMTTTFEQQRNKFRTQPGFIAALDQSGGSTPKALKLYGIPETAYSGEAQMMDLIHAMRTRMITSPSFNGDRILAAILFEATMDRDIDGRPTAEYLWEVKKVVPILKVDKGLDADANGVQLMKPMPALDALLDRAKAKGIFGTKMRSVIKQANPAGIQAVVDQQFQVAGQIIAKGLVPIVEPEVDIHCPDKAAAETLLKAAILAKLDQLPSSQEVMLKLTIPDKDNLYAECIAHPRVLKVVALSGGYSRDEANKRLARQKGMVASFSRALTEGLSAQQTQAEFDAALDKAIESIYQASKA